MSTPFDARKNRKGVLREVRILPPDARKFLVMEIRVQHGKSGMPGSGEGLQGALDGYAKFLRHRVLGRPWARAK